MPKIPMYQGQVGVAAGQLSPRANASAFAAGGSALADFGKAVTSAGQVAGQIEENKNKLEFQAQSLELQKERIKTDFAIARQEADAENFLTENLIASADELAALGRDPSINSIEKYDLAYAPIQDKYLSNIDQLNVSAERKQEITNRMLASMNSTRMTGMQNSFNKGLDKQTATFNEYALTQAREVSSGKIEIGVAVAEYEKAYDRAVADGLSPSVTPEKFLFGLERDAVLVFARENKGNLNGLETKVAQISDQSGNYALLTEVEREFLINQLNDEIEDAKTIVSFNAAEKGEQALSESVNANATSEQSAQSIANGREAQAALENAGNFQAAAELGDKLDIAEGLSSKLDGLTYQSKGDVKATQAEMRAEEAAAIGTPSYNAIVEKNKLVTDRMIANQEAFTEDPALYVIGAETKRGNENVTMGAIFSRQQEMGVDPSDIRVMTQAKTDEFIANIKESDAPSEINATINSLVSGKSVAVKNAVVKQLRDNGFDASLQFAANKPNHHTSRDILAASNIPSEKLPTKGNLAKLQNAIMATDEMQTHAESMGFGTMSGFMGDDLSSMEGFTSEINNVVLEHRDAVAKLATKYAIDAGVDLSGGTIEDGTMTPHIERALKLLDAQYSYEKVNGHALRMGKAFDSVAGEVKQGLQYTMAMIPADDIYVEFDGLQEGSPEFEAQKETFVRELRENFRAVTQQGDSSAVITAKDGGAVFVKVGVAHPSGGEATQLEPLVVPFRESATAVETNFTGKIDLLNERRMQAERGIRDMPGSSKRTPEENALFEELQAIVSSTEETLVDVKRAHKDAGLTISGNRIIGLRD